MFTLRTLLFGGGEALPGTEGGRTPFFSPDGNWIGFIALAAFLVLLVVSPGFRTLVFAMLLTGRGGGGYGGGGFGGGFGGGGRGGGGFSGGGGSSGGGGASGRW